MVGVDSEALPVAFPRQVGERLGYFLLGQASRQAIGPEAVLTGLHHGEGLSDGDVVLHNNDCRGCDEEVSQQEEPGTDSTSESTRRSPFHIDVAIPILGQGQSSSRPPDTEAWPKETGDKVIIATPVCSLRGQRLAGEAE